MPEIIALGESLVEIMRRKGVPFTKQDVFLGPYPSGAPAIFADAAARLGASTGLISVVGQDDFGLVVKERLRRDGVDTRHVRVARGFPTGVAFVTYERDGSRKFIFHLKHAAAGQLCAADVKAEYFRKAKFLHVMGSTLFIGDGARKACMEAVRIAERAGVKISFDPNLRPELASLKEIRRACEPVLRRAHVVLPSGEEAKILTGEDDPLEACRKLLRLGPGIVALKRGRFGSTVLTEEVGEGTHVAAFKVKEVDPTGAGDSYDAGFVTGLLRGHSLKRAATLANAVGALSVTKFGPMEGCPNLSEVSRFMASRGGL
ncbi:MAG: sugar kinase [Candidatus Brockarchaeota archaeon]|nr:sugar kinase [Candidatus Brockarchaeota archaeon]